MESLRGISFVERFWQKTLYVGDCIMWIGGITKAGYGQVHKPGTKYGKIYAHRVAYELANGAIQQGFEIDHLCRNPRCVNPAHLKAVTHQQNMTAPGCINPTKIHSLKTHCPRGHAYTGDNIYLDYFKETGRRLCRQCTKLNNDATYARRRAARGIQVKN